MPLFALVTGNMIDAYGSSENIEVAARRNLFYYLYLAAGSFFTTLAMFFCWKIAGERQAAKCRK